MSRVWKLSALIYPSLSELFNIAGICWGDKNKWNHITNISVINPTQSTHKLSPGSSKSVIDSYWLAHRDVYVMERKYRGEVKSPFYQLDQLQQEEEHPRAWLWMSGDLLEKHNFMKSSLWNQIIKSNARCEKLIRVFFFLPGVTDCTLVGAFFLV